MEGLQHATHLNWSGFAVMEVFLHKGPLPVNTIGPKVMLTSGAISVAVDRLVRPGLVSRQNELADRRARVVHQTAEDKTLIECAFAQHAAAMERATAGLSKPERIQAIALLKNWGSAPSLQAGGSIPSNY